MLTKNNSKILFYLLISFIFNLNLHADEFNITAKEILIDKDNEIVTGIGSVQAEDSKGRIISADKIVYKKLNKLLIAENNVVVDDLSGNILKANKATYDKVNEIIITYDDTELVLKEGYNIKSKNVSFDTINRILSSTENSYFTDIDNNFIETSMFQYQIEKNLFSSVGNIKIIDVTKNKYFFKELHIDTKKKEMVGSDVSVVLNKKNFGTDERHDPRFVSNDIYLSKDESVLSKGVFTVCKKRDGKCPPWSLMAKKIRHDKINKTIYYDNATLKVYDIPIFYFPKFFHPDPTVKRQSGFLTPSLTNSTNVGIGFSLPYFWAISQDKDMTFTPKVYSKENLLLFNEYRQALKGGSLILDSSYFPGYKNTSKTKSDGSRSHIFGELDLNLFDNKPYENNLKVQFQRTSNDSYFRKHDINTELVESDDTNLENEIKYRFSKDDMYLNVSASIYQNLRKEKNSDQYEVILPNILYGKTFFTEKFGTIDLQSNALYSKYDTNRQKTFLTNDVIWNPQSIITKGGFVNKFEGMIRNTNYEAKNNEFKDEGMNNEISAVIAHKTSLPMKKKGVNYNNLFSPNFMVRFAPGHMIDLDTQDTRLGLTNLYSLNKTTEIENGLSAILGFDYKINEKIEGEGEREKLSLSLGQVFNYKENKDIPSKSSLDQKMSDVVGELKYNFASIGKIDYKFSVDHNLNDINYSEISTELNFNKIQFNLDYLEEQNHIGNEHYISPGVTYNFSDNNKFSFSAKKNYKTDSTEFYNMSYQYAIDCLTAGVTYRREFYQDDTVEAKNSLMFTITFVPFGSVKTPGLTTK